jgi:molecular chaperone GrpE
MTPDFETDPTQQDPPSPADAADDPAAIRAKAAERDEYLDRLKRTMAEFQNYKARVTKEKSDIRRFATADVMRSVLPVLDNLERATAAAPKGQAGALQDGVRMVIDQFARALDLIGVKPVVTDGARFDPTSMEAVARVETDEAAENTVIEVFEKGYRLDDLVIRPARVAVAAPKQEE